MALDNRKSVNMKQDILNAYVQTVNWFSENAWVCHGTVLALIVSLILIAQPGLACVNNSLWVADATCTNCTNASAAYVCFDWQSEIDSGILTTNWYQNDEVLNTTTNATNEGYCYNNFNTSQLCTTNVTFYNDTWMFDLYSVDANGTNFTTCGFAAPGCHYANYRQINCAGCPDGMPLPINGSFFNVTNTEQIVWTAWDSANTLDLFYDDETAYSVGYDSNCTNHSMEVEHGNGTSYQNWTVWESSDFLCVYHWVEGSGNLMQDSTINNGTATRTGNIDWRDGLWGYGSTAGAAAGDYWNITDANQCNITDENTLMGWFYRTGEAAGNTYLLSRETGGCPPNNCGYFIWIDNAERVTCFYYVGTAADTCTVTSTASLNANEWEQWACVKNATHVSIFINGTLDGSATCGFTPTSTGRNTIIANRPIVANGWALGYSDEVWIIDEAMDDSWINMTYVEYIKTLGSEQAGGAAFTNYTTFDMNVTRNYGLYTIDIQNEEDNTDWDLTITQNETITTICPNSVDYRNVTVNEFQLITEEAPRYFRIDVNHTNTGENYYRKQVPTCTWPCTETITQFLVDLDDWTLVELTLLLKDYIGGYSGALLRFTRPIEGTVEIITSDYFDAESKSILYLIQNAEYQLYIRRSDGTDERGIGYLWIDSDTSKTVSIGEAEYSPDGTRLHEDVLWDLNYTWSNASAGYIYFSYNDTLNETSWVRFYLCNASVYGNITQGMCTDNSTGLQLAYFDANTTSTLQFTHYIYENQTDYFYVWRAYHTNFPELRNSESGFIILEALGKLIEAFQFSTDIDVNRMWLHRAGLFATFILALSFGAIHSLLGAFAVAGTATIFNMARWIDFTLSMPNPDPNINTYVITLLWAIAFGYAFVTWRTTR